MLPPQPESGEGKVSFISKKLKGEAKERKLKGKLERETENRNEKREAKERETKKSKVIK